MNYLLIEFHGLKNTLAYVIRNILKTNVSEHVSLSQLRHDLPSESPTPQENKNMGSAHPGLNHHNRKVPRCN
jgi:hypothetical protein